MVEEREGLESKILTVLIRSQISSIIWTVRSERNQTISIYKTRTIKINKIIQEFMRIYRYRERDGSTIHVLGLEIVRGRKLER